MRSMLTIAFGLLIAGLFIEAFAGCRQCTVPRGPVPQCQPVRGPTLGDPIPPSQMLAGRGPCITEPCQDCGVPPARVVAERYVLSPIVWIILISAFVVCVAIWTVRRPRRP